MLERRVKQPKFNEHQSRLTPFQKVAVMDLYSYGYDLAFVRKEQDESVAVLTLDGNIAIVHEDGEVESANDLPIR